MMAFSGARGNISQVRQLVGMRGLMADSQGQIIDLPIKANFREGLNVTEYIISSYGARKGLVDTALKTADSGYLTRRLVDVAQDVIVREVDCNTKRGIEMRPISEGDKDLVKLSERLFGRTMGEDVVNPETGEVIGREGEIINRKMSLLIDSVLKKPKKVKVRSPLTCESQYGVCQKCYGWSLTNNRPVDQGEAIGIIAAQSIGEPGTQLTMRTFHTGGAVSGGTSRTQVKAPGKGILTFKIQSRSIRTAYGDVMEQTIRDGVLKVTVGEKEHNINVPTGTLINLPNNSSLAGQVLQQCPVKKNLTERASKDITADISGRSCSGASTRQKTRRQATSRANRAGIIWHVIHRHQDRMLSSRRTLLMYWPKFKSLPNTVVKCVLDQNWKPKSLRLVATRPKPDWSKIKNSTSSSLLFRLTTPSLSLVRKVTSEGQQERIIHYKVVNEEVVENGKIIAELGRWHQRS
jgi:DNA-directed RNA polymerase subunit beta'